MTLRTGMKIGVKGAFTLIELVLVMALLATLMAVVAPRLSGSIRQRNLEQEATRLVALVEYARDEAVSQGMPMVVWIDPQTSTFGMEARPGYAVRQGRAVEFRLREDVEFDLGRAMRGSGVQSVIEVASDGALETESLDEVWLLDQSGGSVGVVLMTNGWGYEVLRETAYANRLRTMRR